MHIGVVFGIVLPILAATGAVAFGSIKDISQTLAQTPPAAAEYSVPEDRLARAGATNATTFLAEGTATWELPQHVALAIPDLVDQDVNTAQPIALQTIDVAQETTDTGQETAENPTSAPDATRDGPDPETTTNRMSERPDVIVPLKSDATAMRKPRAAPRVGQERQAEPARTSPKFQMPWQTGVFQ